MHLLQNTISKGNMFPCQAIEVSSLSLHVY
jgi:hypothetical protein